eukprot:UN12224
MDFDRKILLSGLLDYEFVATYYSDCPLPRMILVDESTGTHVRDSRMQACQNHCEEFGTGVRVMATGYYKHGIGRNRDVHGRT